MHSTLLEQIKSQLLDTRSEGLYKQERIIFDQQKALITINSGQVINFCANNYLGLANHPDVILAAKHGLETHGFGMASVRFICGTQDIHKALERQISQFVATEDAILYPSCFDANGGLFETLLGPEDAVISDALNHASIIDGIRLCKAKRYRYKNNDMTDLKAQLTQAQADGARHLLIATDGVFSMDGIIADLASICEIAQEHDALVMVDDCHATGFIGAQGRGTAEYCNVLGKIDIITGTLGKALGGASGGFVASKKPIVDWLRQRSRPYLFSNSVAPPIVSASLKALELAEQGHTLRQQLSANSAYFRKNMTQAGFTLAGNHHPIIPVMLGDAKIAALMADQLLEKGVYVTGFSFPVVPKGQARIRTQMSAAHTQAQLDHAIQMFIEVGKSLGVIE